MELVRGFVAGVILGGWVLLARGENKTKTNPSNCDFPAIYNLGDSNSDTGGIYSAFYYTALPSGETFFGETAGRASDGRLIIDFLASHLGLPFLGAYLDSLASSFRQGANFATGGATIRQQNESFSVTRTSPFSLDIQAVQYSTFKRRSVEIYDKANECEKSRLPKPDDFSRALYTFDIGQNDLAHGFQKMTYDQLKAEIPDIVQQLAQTVQQLYEVGGARAFWIHNTGPIGCLPVTLHSIHDPDPGFLDELGCVKAQNEMAMEFNNQLKDRVVRLRAQLPEAAITYVDLYAAKSMLIANASAEGFVDPKEICCGYHDTTTRIYCGQKGMVNGTQVYAGSCEDPSVYISWDGVHYTDAANHWVADKIKDGSFSDPPIPITHACHGPSKSPPIPQ